jgi:hypothetical protein
MRAELTERALRLDRRAKRQEHGAKRKTKEIFPHAFFPRSLLSAPCSMRNFT